MVKEISGPEFALLAGYVKEVSGIELDASKRYLMESRLSPLLEKAGCDTYTGLYRKAKQDPKGEISSAIVDALTTHETSFFRDGKPFELLRARLLPRLLSRDARWPMRIWSMACSTGQEAYSVAIAMRETLHDLSRRDIRILGSDISEDAIKTAERGVYSAFEVRRGLTPEQVLLNFQAKGADHEVSSTLRSLVQFRRGNIFEPDGIGPFDLILCRNVAIYFTLEDRRRLFEKISKLLKPDGFLLIGSTETLMGISTRFQKHEELGAAYYTLSAD